MKKQEGFSIVLVLVIVVLVIVAISAGAYYFLKISGQSSNATYMMGNNSILPTPVPPAYTNTFKTNIGSSNAPLTPLDDTNSLLQDLNNTKVNSADSDIEQLNSAASSL
ncbi:MAG TPA: hypothetical protein VF185_04680 [Patescibacteria group bacterium]